MSLFPSLLTYPPFLPLLQSPTSLILSFLPFAPVLSTPAPAAPTSAQHCWPEPMLHLACPLRPRGHNWRAKARKAAAQARLLLPGAVEHRRMSKGLQVGGRRVEILRVNAVSLSEQQERRYKWNIVSEKDWACGIFLILFHQPGLLSRRRLSTDNFPHLSWYKVLNVTNSWFQSNQHLKFNGCRLRISGEGL